jgi:hypothetical protein
MNPDPLAPFTHALYTKLVPFFLLCAVGVGILSILKFKFENWLESTIRNWKKNRAAKKYSGMSDDEILDSPHCPACNSMMKLRTSKRDGGQFWGCGSFPKCRGTRAV